MPKKFKGENSKAVEAKARKAAIADAAKSAKEKAIQDAYWADDDKSLKKKQDRKAEREAKRVEALNRKKEKEELYQNEMETLPSKRTAEVKKTEKVTRAQIAADKEQERRNKQAEELNKRNLALPETEDTIEENINRMVADSVVNEGVVEARSVEDAISALSVAEEIDRHPERRMKAAYSKFEDEHLPRLKKENPNMRQSQLKQMLRKDWQKCPDNPMNQRFLSYNAKKS